MARGTTASRDLYEASSLHVLKTKGEPDKRELVTVSETSTKSLRHSSIRYEPPEWLIVKTYSWRIRTTKDGVTGERSRSEKADREAGALKWLSKSGCQHVPTLLSTFKIRTSTPGGMYKEHGLIMTKVPGVTLEHCYATLSDAEQTRVKKAFRIALQAIHARGVDNGSHHLGNVIWDSKAHK